MPQPCPQCDVPVPQTPENSWRPFCSERCKLIDLGHWLDGDYVIPGGPADPLHTEEEPDDG